jgi:hypothetical protein
VVCGWCVSFTPAVTLGGEGGALNIYGHLYNEMQDEAAQLMDELVMPTCPQLHPKNESLPSNLVAEQAQPQM